MEGRALFLKSLLAGAFLALPSCNGESIAETAPEATTSTPIAEEPAPALPPTGDLAEGFAPIAFDLAGTSWLVIAIDAKPLADRYSDLATVHFTRSMLYWQACNHHEGLYVRTGTSFAMGRVVTTQANCAQDSPDSVMARIMGRRPLIGSNAEGKIMFAAGGRSMTLSQIDRVYSEAPAPPLERAPFRLMSADAGSRPPVLSFKDGSFSVWMDCADAITGRAVVGSGRMKTSNLENGPCNTHRPTATTSLEGFFAHDPAIARGPNGELMLSDGDTVIHGQQCHPDPSGCEHANSAGESGA